jgi:hypothetical protein
VIRGARTIMRAWRASWLLGSLALVAFSTGLAACASSGSSTSTMSPSPHTSVIAPSVSVPFDPAENARAEVAFTACAPTAGAWVVSGTVTNKGSATKTFQLVVDFASVPGSTVLSSAVVTVPDVEEHATVRWSARGARGAAHVACLLRQAQAS